MPLFAANLSSLWAELPYLDRFDAAAAAGFYGVAVPFPYNEPAKETQRALMRNGLELVQMSAPPPNYTGGQRGFAAVPEAQDRFRYDLRRALRYCEALRTPILQIMAGQASGDEARSCLIDNLRYAVGQLPENVTLTLEPRATPGAFLHSLEIAADVLEAVASPRVGLQLHTDVLPASGFSLKSALARLGSTTKHVQIGELQAEEVAQFAAAVAEYTASKWIAVDVETNGETDQALEWLKPSLARQSDG